MITKLKLRIRNWLGITELENMLYGDIQRIKELFRTSSKRQEKIEINIKDICSNAIMGVDLCYRGESAIIIVKYDRKTNGFTIIEDSKCSFPAYRDAVFYLRKLARNNNVDVLCVDKPAREFDPDIPIEDKILPKRELVGYYQNRFD